VVECAGGDQQCYEVLDCSDNAGCVTRKVAFDFQACADKDGPHKCANFERRLPDVSVMSDSYNFISSPFTSERLEAELVTGRLKSSWDLEFLPDGSMLVTQEDGQLVHLDKAGNKTELLVIEVYQTIEAGLLGLAVDPDFTDNHYIYVFYTTSSDADDPANKNLTDPKSERILNRVSRWTLEGGRATNEVILLDDLPGTVMHAGGRLEFGPDGKLYVTTGDGATREDAVSEARTQDISFLGGKVLRMNPDGSVPDDNPVAGSYVYSRGHRNPSGLAWHPDTGFLYTSEHGPHRYDEVNRITPGGNYGWGSYKCHVRISDIEAEDPLFPVLCFDKWTIAPGGLEFVSDPGHPWHGSLFVGSLRGKHLHRHVFDGDEVVKDEVFYIVDRKALAQAGAMARMNPRIRDVEYRDGALYLLGDFSGIVKLTP
jgi:glucose/arabinose dehydrogenase